MTIQTAIQNANEYLLLLREHFTLITFSTTVHVLLHYSFFKDPTLKTFFLEVTSHIWEFQRKTITFSFILISQ